MAAGGKAKVSRRCWFSKGSQKYGSAIDVLTAGGLRRGLRLRLW